LGTLTAANGAFSLNYPGDDHHTNLLSAGDKLEITQEQGNVSLPTGQPVLTGTFPPKAFVHIKHLLVSFPGTPGNIGLLVGLLQQTQLLNGQALVLNNAVSGQNQAAIQCVAQSMIDIIEGSAGSHYQALGANCASLGITQTGDGYGLLGSNGYVMNAAAHAFLAAHQPDTTAIIRLHAGHVQIATTNIQGWLNTVEHDTLDLLNNPNNTSKVPEIVQLSNQAYQGIDTNGDESVDPVPGEAGAVTAYAHGQLIASLPLTPVSQ
jgi:hypothetical protein